MTKLHDELTPSISASTVTLLDTKTVKFRYYDLKRNWRKIEPHLSDPTLNDILVTDFNKFTFGRWGKPFGHGDYPFDFESADWWCEHRGKFPRYWRYVKHGACHWLVNFAWTLATLTQPKRDWRIITSDRHSTVWDQDRTLFDFNFQAFGIDPDECFRMAFDEMLEPGELLDAGEAEHYTENVQRRAQERDLQEA
jgi:hypothetical protein